MTNFCSCASFADAVTAYVQVRQPAVDQPGEPRGPERLELQEQQRRRLAAPSPVHQRRDPEGAPPQAVHTGIAAPTHRARNTAFADLYLLGVQPKVLTMLGIFLLCDRCCHTASQTSVPDEQMSRVEQVTAPAKAAPKAKKQPVRRAWSWADEADLSEEDQKRLLDQYLRDNPDPFNEGRR